MQLLQQVAYLHDISVDNSNVLITVRFDIEKYTAVILFTFRSTHKSITTARDVCCGFS